MQCFSVDGESFGSVEALWQKTNLLPTKQLEIASLQHLLDSAHWDGNLSARDVFTAPWFYPRHAWRIFKADLSYPILLTWQNEWILLDGMHRLAKLYLLGYRTITIRRVNQTIIDECFVFKE